MPKDEIDPEDPMELCGVAMTTKEDTSDAMTECFTEEFMRLGYGPAQILALFRNRHYLGPNVVLQNRGEDYVRAKIVEVFGWWGHRVALRERAAAGQGVEPVPDPAPDPAFPAPQSIEFETGMVDPGGAAIPRLQT